MISLVFIRVHSWLKELFSVSLIGGFSESVGSIGFSAFRRAWSGAPYRQRLFHRTVLAEASGEAGSAALRVRQASVCDTAGPGGTTNLAVPGVNLPPGCAREDRLSFLARRARGCRAGRVAEREPLRREALESCHDSLRLHPLRPGTGRGPRVLGDAPDSSVVCARLSGGSPDRTGRWPVPPGTGPHRSGLEVSLIRVHPWGTAVYRIKW